MLIRKDLCGEAIRLLILILKKKDLRTGAGYALFALFCFHSARLESKVVDGNILLDLKHQDRSKWYIPLIDLGNSALLNSTTFDDVSVYHFESSIAAEHANAKSFEDTKWAKVLDSYLKIHENQPTDYSLMNLAIVYIQLKNASNALLCINQIDAKKLAKRIYLYYGVFAEYYLSIGDSNQACDKFRLAIEHVTNESEKTYLINKLDGVIKGQFSTKFNP